MSKRSRRNKRQIIISPGKLLYWHVEDKLAPELPQRLVKEGYVPAKCGVWFRMKDRTPLLKDCKQCKRDGGTSVITSLSLDRGDRIRELREVAHLFDLRRKKLPKSITEVEHVVPQEPS